MMKTDTLTESESNQGPAQPAAPRREKQRRIQRDCYAESPEKLEKQWLRHAWQYRQEAVRCHRRAQGAENFTIKEIERGDAHNARRAAWRCYEHALQLRFMVRFQTYYPAATEAALNLDKEFSLEFQATRFFSIAVSATGFSAGVWLGQGFAFEGKFATIPEAVGALRAWYQHHGKAVAK